MNDNALDSTIIPYGIYCYSTSPKGKKIRCPYWLLFKDKPFQNNGYCKFLGRGDWEVTNRENSWRSLLWDSVKECGINEPSISELVQLKSKGE